MKYLALLAFTAAALAGSGSLPAQTTGTEPTPAPLLGPTTTSAPSPAFAEPAGKKPRAVSKVMLEKYDKNKSGALEPDERALFETERPVRRAEKLKKFDKNGDGKLDDDEKIQMRVERLREKDAARKAAAPKL